MKIYHIVNPYITDPASEDTLVQQKTLDSIRAAIAYAADYVDVTLVVKTEASEAADFERMLSGVPSIFAPLKRTSAELEVPFKVSRRLPLLNDLVDLERLAPASEFAENSNAFMVVTNMDICVQPYFYTELARILGSGIDCFVINRRTVSKDLLHSPLSDSYVAYGDKHIGHDCFVVPLPLLRKFNIKNHILGIGFVFRPFLLNCILHSKHFHEFDDVFLTFHFGDDMEWKSDKYSDYLAYNKQMLIDVYSELDALLRNANEKQLGFVNRFFRFDFLPKF